MSNLASEQRALFTWAKGRIAEILRQPVNTVDPGIVEYICTSLDINELPDFLAGFSPLPDAFAASFKFAEQLAEKKQEAKPQVKDQRAAVLERQTVPRESVPKRSEPSSPPALLSLQSSDVPLDSQRPSSKAAPRDTESDEEEEWGEEVYDPDKPTLGQSVVPAKGMPGKRKLAQHKLRGRQPPKRMICLCNGADHGFLGNCIDCGKIFCNQEGPGPCIFCGCMSITKDGSIEKERRTMYQETPGYADATALSKRLIEYDKEAAKRMQVWDMQTDFYAEAFNPWLPDEKREQAARIAAEQARNLEFGHRELGYLTIDLTAKTFSMSDQQMAFNEECEKQLAAFLESEPAELEAERLAREKAEPIKLSEHGLQMYSESAAHRPEARSLYAQYQFQKKQEAEGLRRRPRQEEVEVPPTTSEWESFAVGKSKLSRGIQDIYQEIGTEGARYVAGDSTVTASSSQWAAKTHDRRQKAAAGAAVIEPLSGKGSSFRRRVEDLGDFLGLMEADDVDFEGDARTRANEEYEKKNPDIAFCGVEFEDDEADEGVCLTLHQPWASLLARGFKRLEGRIWKTDYRGRLWIHAASREPDDETLDQMAAYMSKVYGGEHPPLPQYYPTSAILGCVDLVDLVQKSELQSAFDSGRLSRGGQSFVSRREDNDSPYLFICKAPRVLVVPVQMQGEHKLWNIPRSRLPALRRSLRPVIWAPLNKLTESRSMENDLRKAIDEGEQRIGFIPAVHKADQEATRLNELLMDKYLDSAQIYELKIPPEAITIPVIGALHVANAFPRACLRSFIATLDPAMLFYFDEDSNGNVADFGKRFDPDFGDWISLTPSAAVLPDVPRRASEMFQCVLETVEKARRHFTHLEFPRFKSVGGPHLPPLEAARVLVMTEQPFKQALASPIPANADPVVVFAVSGHVNITLEISGQKMGHESQMTKETLEILSRQAKTFKLAEGDALLLNAGVRVSRFTRFYPGNPDSVLRGCAIGTFCANCWRS